MKSKTEPTELEREVALAIEDQLFGPDLGFEGFSLANVDTASMVLARAAISACFRWRPIETVPPPEGKSVLIALPDADRGQPGCEVGQWWGGEDTMACWWTNGGPNAGSDMHDWSNATHWLQLPPPPEDAAP